MNAKQKWKRDYGQARKLLRENPNDWATMINVADGRRRVIVVNDAYVDGAFRCRWDRHANPPMERLVRLLHGNFNSCLEIKPMKTAIFNAREYRKQLFEAGFKLP